MSVQNIPIIIISYNNYKYVENTLNQILNINKEYYDNIQILDNCSYCLETINFLKNTNVKVIYNNNNNGPWIFPWENSHIYNILPEKYILTDPDLEFNKNIPKNFIEVLSNLSDKYKCNRVGFALDISDFEKMYKFTYADDKNIYDYELRFWENKIDDNDYELYNAGIDTTFCLINKQYVSNDNSNCLRIAGNFTTKHLPWYETNHVYSVYENYLLCKKQTNISSISTKILSFIDNEYLTIIKNDEQFLIKNSENDINLNFWKNTYTDWEKETFIIFDKYLDVNKIFIDIGGWIGTTSMYGSRKSKYVYCIEADKESFNDISLNMQTNCKNNYKIINKAIYNINDILIKFGKNKFLNNSKMNDSTSQIYDNDDSVDDCYLINTITIESIINDNKIKTNEISLIKVDIEGGEEYILNDLYNIHKKYNIPLYISFHYEWWKNKNLDRFDFLTKIQKDNIVKCPFVSMIF